VVAVHCPLNILVGQDTEFRGSATVAPVSSAVLVPPATGAMPAHCHQLSSTLRIRILDACRTGTTKGEAWKGWSFTGNSRYILTLGANRRKSSGKPVLQFTHRLFSYRILWTN